MATAALRVHQTVHMIWRGGTFQTNSHKNQHGGKKGGKRGERGKKKRGSRKKKVGFIRTQPTKSSGSISGWGWGGNFKKRTAGNYKGGPMG